MKKCIFLNKERVFNKYVFYFEHFSRYKGIYESHKTILNRRIGDHSQEIVRHRTYIWESRNFFISECCLSKKQFMFILSDKYGENIH